MLKDFREIGLPTLLCSVRSEGLSMYIEYDFLFLLKELQRV